MKLKATNRIIEHLNIALAPLGEFRARPMFGGHGLYIDGIIFGIIAYDILFLKTDAHNRPDFEKAKSKPFTYEKSTGKTTILTYWECPASIEKNPEKLCAWVEKSLKVSINSKKKKKQKKTSKESGNSFL